jgi:hypothetical protein
VRISISGIRNGRISGGKCLVTAKKKGKRCTLRQLQGTLSRSGVAGSNRVAFSGRIGALPLPKGRYVATIVAADAGLNSTSRSASFSIVK